MPSYGKVHATAGIFQFISLYQYVVVALAAIMPARPPKERFANVNNLTFKNRCDIFVGPGNVQLS